MNLEIEPIHIGEVEDIDKDSVENFEHEEIDYAIFHLGSGFFATQGHCNCEDQSFLSEGIVSADPINNEELAPLKIYDVSAEENNICLNL